MSDIALILAANQRFYSAIAHGDMVGMEAVWSDDHRVACIHPGWPPLTDRDMVMRSWREILNRPIAIRCDKENVVIHGDSAIVVCQESLDGAVLAATNVFVREDGGWRLFHHQATPMAQQPERTAPPVKKVLH